jgi:hypothetical protein
MGNHVHLLLRTGKKWCHPLKGLHISISDLKFTDPDVTPGRCTGTGVAPIVTSLSVLAVAKRAPLNVRIVPHCPPG